MGFSAGSYEITGPSPQRAMIEFCALVPEIGYKNIDLGKGKRRVSINGVFNKT
jgi:hypothetical protein